MRASCRSWPGSLAGLGCRELALCPRDGGAGHRRLAAHDGRQAPQHAAGIRSLHEALNTTIPPAVLGCPVPGRPSQSGASRAPQNPPQLRDTAADPTGIPRTKRHTAAHLLGVLKNGEELFSSVDACELGCWGLFQVSALGVIELLKRRPRSLGVKRRCQIEGVFSRCGQAVASS